MCVQHIIQHHVKRVYWSLESRRPDSVWAEWVPNTSGTDPGFQVGGSEISEKIIRIRIHIVLICIQNFKLCLRDWNINIFQNWGMHIF